MEGIEIQIARKFHKVYEKLAPEFGYTTRPETREFDENSSNGKLMIAVCKEVVLEELDKAKREAQIEVLTEIFQTCYQEDSKTLELVEEKLSKLTTK